MFEDLLKPKTATVTPKTTNNIFGNLLTPSKPDNTTNQTPPSQLLPPKEPVQNFFQKASSFVQDVLTGFTPTEKAQMAPLKITPQASAKTNSVIPQFVDPSNLDQSKQPKLEMPKPQIKSPEWDAWQAQKQQDAKVLQQKIDAAKVKPEEYFIRGATLGYGGDAGYKNQAPAVTLSQKGMELAGQIMIYSMGGEILGGIAGAVGEAIPAVGKVATAVSEVAGGSKIIATAVKGVKGLAFGTIMGALQKAETMKQRVDNAITTGKNFAAFEIIAYPIITFFRPSFESLGVDTKYAMNQKASSMLMGTDTNLEAVFSPKEELWFQHPTNPDVVIKVTRQTIDAVPAGQAPGSSDSFKVFAKQEVQMFKKNPSLYEELKSLLKGEKTSIPTGEPPVAGDAPGQQQISTQPEVSQETTIPGVSANPGVKEKIYAGLNEYQNMGSPKDLATYLQTPEGKQVARQTVENALAHGILKPDGNGSITVYNISNPSDSELSSVTYSKTLADKSSIISEFKIKPEDVAYFVGGPKSELLIQRKDLNPESAYGKYLKNTMSPAEYFARNIERRLGGQEALRQSPKGAELLKQQLAKQQKRTELRAQVDALYNSIFAKPDLEVAKPSNETVGTTAEIPLDQITKQIEKIEKNYLKESGFGEVKKVSEKSRLIKDIQSVGGIKAYSNGVWREEMRDIPVSVRRTAGQNLDQVVESLNANRGWNLQSESELLDILTTPENSQPSGTPESVQRDLYAENAEYRDLVDQRQEQINKSLDAPIDELSPEYLTSIFSEVSHEDIQNDDTIATAIIEKEGRETESPQSQSAGQDERKGNEITTAREAAIDLIRHSVERGDTLESLKSGQQGQYGGTYDASIGGYANGKNITANKIQVSKLHGVELNPPEIFSLQELFNEIKAGQELKLELSPNFIEETKQLKTEVDVEKQEEATQLKNDYENRITPEQAMNLTPQDIDQRWSTSLIYTEFLNKGLIQRLKIAKEELSNLKNVKTSEAKARKLELKNWIDHFEKQIGDNENQNTNDSMEFGINLSKLAIDEAIKQGLDLGEYQGDPLENLSDGWQQFRDDFMMMITEPGYVESTWNTKLTDVVSELVKEKKMEITTGSLEGKVESVQDFGAGNPSDILGSKSYKNVKKGFDAYFDANEKLRGPISVPEPKKEGPIQLNAGIDPGFDKFLEQDIKPGIKKTTEGVAKTWDLIKKTFSPSSRTAEAQVTASILRKNIGKMARQKELIYQRLVQAKKTFDGYSKKQSLAFIDKLESGVDMPESRQFTTIIRKALGERWAKIQAISGTGAYIKNYFPHIWKDSEQASDILAKFYGRRPLEGSKSFLEQRIIPTIKQGVALGLEPISYNPVDLIMARITDMDKFLMAYDTLKEYQEYGNRLVMKTDEPPKDWVRINEKMSKTFRFISEAKGNWYMPEQAATIVNNYLSPGLAGNPIYDAFRMTGNTLNQAQLGLSAFHAVFTLGDVVVSKAALELQKIFSNASAPSKLTSALKVLTSPVAAPYYAFTNLIRGNKLLVNYFKENPQIPQMVDALEKAGGRVRMDQIYKNNSIDAFFRALRHGNLIGAGIRTPGAMLEALSKPIMEYIVPRQKLGVFSDMASHILEQAQKGGWNEQKTILRLQQAWDSVDNRLGQLVYDNLFWNKVLKDLGMASTRSLGWNLGTIRELGGGLVDITKTPFRLFTAKGRSKINMNPKMAYTLVLPFIMGVWGAIIFYLYNGKAPESLLDFYYPRTGRKKPDGTDERISLPSYMKDVFAYSKEPSQTLINKIHPLVSTLISMLENKDYYGTDIRNANDPVINQIGDEFKYLAQQYIPFSITGAIQRKNAGGNLGQQAESFFGLNPAPSYITKTNLEREISSIYSKRFGGTQTQEEFASSKAKTNIRNLYQQGKLDEANKALNDALTKGIIQEKGVATFIKDANIPSDVRAFSALSKEDQIGLLSKMSLEELKKYAWYSKEKSISQLSQNAKLFVDMATKHQIQKPQWKQGKNINP